MSVKSRLEALEHQDPGPISGLLPIIVSDGDVDRLEELLAQGVRAKYFSEAVEDFV